MGLRCEEQAAYRKNYSTIDQIFVLQSLVQKHLIKRKGRFYVIFVDFAKAFDGLPHQHIIFRLMNIGIHGKCLKVLKSMYKNLKSCVKMPKGLTDYFECTIGTRQGCMLSPFIFSMYIQELVDMMKCYDCKGTYVNENAQNIMILLYADDIAEGATTVKHLQDMIDVLELYCSKWGLTVNQSKTKIVIFKNGGVRK